MVLLWKAIRQYLLGILQMYIALHLVISALGIHSNAKFERRIK